MAATSAAVAVDPLHEGPLAPARAIDTVVSVTMLGTLPPWRGVSPFTTRLVEALDRIDGVDLEFLDFSALYPRRFYPGGSPVEPGATCPSFSTVDVRRSLAWYNPCSWVRAGMSLRGDIVHAQVWTHALAPVYWAVLGIARLRGKRVILTLHNVSPHEGGFVARWLYRSVLGLADSFVVHSKRNAQQLMMRYPRSKGRVRVVPLGMPHVPKNGLTQAEARKQLGLAGDRPVVLAFGNIRPYKGLDVLLRAMRLLREREVRVTVAIVGQPWGSFDSYKELIGELDIADDVRTRLEFVPEEDVQRYFAAADVSVLPYTSFDGQSGAGTLSISFGVPMIVSNVGGLPDLVADERAVVPPNDAHALADALERVVCSEPVRRKLANDSKKKAEELDWDAIGRRTAELYASIGKRRSLSRASDV